MTTVGVVGESNHEVTMGPRLATAASKSVGNGADAGLNVSILCPRFLHHHRVVSCPGSLSQSVTIDEFLSLTLPGTLNPPRVFHELGARRDGTCYNRMARNVHSASP